MVFRKDGTDFNIFLKMTTSQIWRFVCQLPAASLDSPESPLLKIERGKADICHLRRRVEIWAICGIGPHEGFAPNAVKADTQCHDAVW
jgi:hypothetical protein